MRRDEIPDKRAYEKACVEQVEHAFSGLDERRWLEETGRALRQVELRGQFPDTQLVITLYDGRRAQPGERTFSYPLWGDETAVYADKNLQPDPNLMAANIFMWTMEE